MDIWDEINDTLVELFETHGIPYNGTTVARLATRIEIAIDDGTLSDPEPDGLDI